MARRGWPTWRTCAPKLNWDDLAQTPALPLGSWLKTDPWDDKVHMLNAKRYAPMNARDKMPFEVTPIFYKLQRYDEAARRTAGRGKRSRSRPALTSRLQRLTSTAGSAAAPAVPPQSGAAPPRRSATGTNGGAEPAVITQSNLRARA